MPFTLLTGRIFNAEGEIYEWKLTVACINSASLQFCKNVAFMEDLAVFCLKRCHCNAPFDRFCTSLVRFCATYKEAFWRN